MVRKDAKNRPVKMEAHYNEFLVLLHYIEHLARHKMGYPVSLLTYLGVVDNKILGIMPNSLANILLNNVGDPFKDSETSLMEVKKHEREIIAILEKYYGLDVDQARGYVTTGGTEGNFAALWWTKRFLINSGIDSLVAKDDAIKTALREEQELVAGLAKISLNDSQIRLNELQKILDIKNSVAENRNIVQQLLTPTIFYSKGPTHYSVPKIAEILRLNIRTVIPNEDGSINLENLHKEILLHLGAHPYSPVAVIANIGTTVTGAIDDVKGIRKVLESFTPKINYSIHMDGALTGFVMPILKPFGDIKNYFDDLGANTLAVSAHKYPGLSQPCGILLARKAFYEKAFEKGERNIEYVGNILDVTITGSRSGLNVLMFYNALYTLGLHKNNDKLTKMVKINMENAKYLYDKLVNIYGMEQVFYPYHFNVSFPRPSIALAKKYQLMLTGGRATICVLANVSQKLIDQFVNDLLADKERTMEKPAYNIVQLSDEHVKSVVDLFTKSFCDSEPVTKHLGITYEDYIPFAREVVLKAVKEGLSKVAVDKQNHVIACCIAEDIADPFFPKIAHYQKLKPIFALLTELSRPFVEGKKFIKGRVAHVWIAIVDPKYRGLGLSTAIDMATAETLARKGFDFAYAEFTNPVSEKIVNQYSMFQLVNKANIGFNF